MNAVPLKVLVCGSTFGQFWLAALQRYPLRFKVVGLLASGSARSRDCAQRYDIPLYTDIASLPEDIDLACVVLRATVMGGAGSVLAQQLMPGAFISFRSSPYIMRGGGEPALSA
ncbi:thiazolinyl-S-HMWP1 reductase [Klebsiella pneumoniae]|uniref:Thiazolinyl-S-HMWP1 reductase n=1 Tax=Klebsiella pneumoniae TaxID=573 RepID=A0A2X1Q5C1_KLEPN|nr:thiazolinyl-S-HMWP1 reductase [Klebsiella pneumoniae]